MDIVEYFKGKDELEIKEKRLLEIIDRLDKERYKLYCEVIDLDLNSYYKIDYLYIRISNLTDRLEEISNAYEYLTNLELNNLGYASRRYIIENLLAVIASSFASLVNIFAGLVNFIILNRLAKNLYEEENKLISKRVELLDNLDLSIIGTTLENASNFLKGKMNKLYTMEESDTISQDLIVANNYIGCYLADNLSKEDIESLPLNYKQIMVKILQKDLNSKSDDIYELLSELRNKNDNEIKLTKELN